MPISDLYKALEIFGDGMTQYQTQQAVNDATKQLQANQQSLLDEKEKLAQNQVIGNELALRLTGVGAKPEQIAAATSGLVPSASAVSTAQSQKEMQQAGFGQQTKEKKMDRDLAIELQGMKNQALTGKSGMAKSKIALDQAEKFYKINQKQIDSIDGLDEIANLIDSNPSQIGIEIAKTKVMKNAGEDRISDDDIKRAQNDPSLRHNVLRRIGLEVSGEALKDDRVFYSNLLKGLKQNAVSRLDKRTKGYAQSVSSLNEDIDPSLFENAIRERIPSLGSNQQQAPPPDTAAIQTRIAQLNALIAKNPREARVPAMQQKIEALKKQLQGSK